MLLFVSLTESQINKTSYSSLLIQRSDGGNMKALDYGESIFVQRNKKYSLINYKIPTTNNATCSPLLWLYRTLPLMSIYKKQHYYDSSGMEKDL